MSMIFSMRGDQEAVSYLRGLPDAVQQVVLAKMQGLASSISDRIKQKLSGEVLNVRTGALRNSIYARIYDSPGSVSLSVGSRGDVPYASLQEDGGVVQHPGVQRTRGMVPMPMKTAYGALVGFSMKTRAHEILIPARSYVRSTLDEMMPDINNAILDAVTEAASVSS